MSAAQFDYKFGNKNNWRRWVWNRITERLNVKPQEALVLYLAGRNDFDRREALRRGFAEHNLIAAELNREARKVLRARKALCIDGEIIDAASFWPPPIPLHVLHADFACGLEAKILARCFTLIASQALNTAVLSFNFMRGRDASTNEMRERWATWQVSRGLMHAQAPVHRAALFYTEFCFCCFSFIKGCYRSVDSDGIIQLNELRREQIEEFNNCRRRLWEFTNPVFYTYKSESGQMFDSCIFINPNRGLTGGIDYSDYQDACRSHAVTKMITPVLAHRTMRQNKIGIYAD